MLNDANSIFLLLLNFMYKSAAVKIDLAKKGLADILHKLWAWIALNKTISTNALKLLASFTARLPAEDGNISHCEMLKSIESLCYAIFYSNLLRIKI